MVLQHLLLEMLMEVLSRGTSMYTSNGAANDGNETLNCIPCKYL